MSRASPAVAPKAAADPAAVRASCKAPRKRAPATANDAGAWFDAGALAIMPSDGIATTQRPPAAMCKPAVAPPGRASQDNRTRPMLQARLVVGRSDHPLEREADEVADRIVGKADSSPPVVHPATGALQRKCAACEKDDERTLVQPKSTAATTPETAPDAVDAVLQSPGRPLDPPTRAFFESRFRRDLSQVRVHTDHDASRAADSLAAQAFTAGAHIAFGSGRYAPTTASGRHLLAHELTHVMQQAGQGTATIRRAPEDVPELDRKWQAAIADKDWSTAAEVLNAFSREDILKRIARLKKGEVGSLHQAALDDKRLGPDAQIAVLTHKSWLDLNFANEVKSERWSKAAELLNGYSDADIDRKLTLLSKAQVSSLRINAPPWATRVTSRIDAMVSSKDLADARQRADAAQAGAVNDAIAAMSSTDKLGKAVDYAKETFHDDVRKEIEGLFSPTALAAMTAFIILYIAAQLTPAGWVADALALTALTISIIFLGATLLDIIKDLMAFGAAVNATTDKQLRDSGAALARAIAKAGVTLIVALLTHGAKGAAKPYIDSPPTGFADAVTPEGVIVRAPVEAIPAPKSGAVSMAATVPVAGSSGGSGHTGSGGAEEPQKKPAMTSRTDGLRSNEWAQIKKARKFFNLPDTPTPEEPGIVGVLIPEEGGAPIEIKSGAEGGPSGGLQRGGSPRGPGSGLDRYTSGHVEGHVTQVMRERGITRGVLLIEKYFCPNCDRNFTQAMPKGSRLLVVFPDSAETVVSTEM